MEKKERTLLVLKYGAYTCAIVFLLGILLQFVGVSMTLVQNLMIVILGAEMFFCCNEYKQRTQSPLKFKQAFALSWQVSFFAGLIMGIFFFVIIQLAGSDEMVKSALLHKELFIQKGGATVENVEQTIRTIFNPWSLFLLTIMLSMVFGFLLSILVALFVRTPIRNEE